MRKSNRNRILLLPLVFVLLLSACGGQIERRSSFFAMDTAVSLRVYGGSEKLMAAAEEAVAELEARISVTRPDSELAAVNREGGGTLSDTPAALLRRGLALCEETEGALDLSIYPVLRAWGFTTGDYRVPTQGELEMLLENVGYRRVAVAPDGTVSLPVGMQLDLGSVAKGYMGDLLCALLRKGGVKSALLDLGGNIQALGARPDGSNWRVGVRDPRGEGLLGIVQVRDAAVITSGVYERFFEDEDGQIWWHILDPATGYPARNGLISVTVTGEEGLRCDALSTALFVMGEEKAIEFWRGHRDFEMALVTENSTVLLTPGLAERFTPEPTSGYRYETIM